MSAKIAASTAKKVIRPVVQCRGTKAGMKIQNSADFKTRCNECPTSPIPVGFAFSANAKARAISAINRALMFAAGVAAVAEAEKVNPFAKLYMPDEAECAALFTAIVAGASTSPSPYYAVRIWKPGLADIVVTVGHIRVRFEIIAVRSKQSDSH